MTGRTGIIASLAIIAILTGGIVTVFGMPLWQEIRTAYTDRDTAATQASDLEKQRENLKNFANLKQENEALSLRLENLIPSDPSTDQLIVNLEQLANALGLQMNLLAIETSAQKQADSSFGALPAGVDSVRLAVEVAGTFANINGYITELLRNNRLIEIGTVNLSDQAELGISARLSVRAFYKEKITIQESSDTLTINPELRQKLLAPRQLIPLAAPTNDTTGRSDPFAPLP